MTEHRNPPSEAVLALVGAWWTDFGARLEQAVVAWNEGRPVQDRLTFTSQSWREFSIAHPQASSELRLEGTRVRIVDRRAEPTRRNLEADTLVDFHVAAGGIVAVTRGRTTSIEEAATDLFAALLDRLD